jgi:6-phosphogluconolactonase
VKSESVLPRFDLILLGLGPDAHTASLFPGTVVIHEQQRWVVGYFVEKLATHRLTLTPPILNHASEVMFLVVGIDKAAAVQSVLQGPRNPDRFPAQIVTTVDGRLTWLLDQAAASLLDPLAS